MAVAYTCPKMPSSKVMWARELLLQDQLPWCLEEVQLSGVSSYKGQMLHSWFGDPSGDLSLLSQIRTWAPSRLFQNCAKLQCLQCSLVNII